MAYFDAPYRPADLTLNSDAINNSLVGFWPLTDGSGTSAVDVSTGGNDGTQSGGVSWASSEVGTVASFDGVNDRFDLTSIGSMDFSSSDFTVSMWIYVDSISSPEYLWAKQTSGNSPSCTFWFYNSSTLQLIHLASTANCTTDYTIASSLVGGWNHLVASVSSPSSLLASNHAVYLNGDLLTPNASVNGSGTITASSGTLSLAGRISDNLRQLSGDYQNVRIFNSALTATQVEQLYTRPWTGTNYDTEALWLSPPSSPVISSASESTSLMTDCVLWYPLTEGSGTTATDLVGSNDGTLSSVADWNDSGEIGTVLELRLFDASDAYVTTPTITTASQPVTHSLWFRYPGYSGSAYVMDGLNGSYRNTIYFSSSQLWAFGGSSSGTIGSSGQFNDGEWHNLTAVFNGTSSVVYVDGVQEASGNYGSHSWQGTTLGARYNITNMFSGDLQNYRVWERALTAEEALLLYERPWIGAEYNESDPLYPPVPSSLTPLDSGNSILTDQELWLPLTETDDFASGAADISGNSNNGTQTGGVLSDFSVPGTVASLDGVNDRITVSSLQVSSSGSVSFWGKTDLSGSINYAAFVSHGGDNAGVFEIANQSTSSTCRWRLNFTGVADSGIAKQAGTIPTDEWAFYCLTWNSTNWAGYFDGVQLFNEAHGLTAANITKNLYVGTRRTSQTSGHMPGNVSNVRIWSRSLSSSEVADLYYEPWIGSAYPSTSTGAPRFLINGLRPLLVNGGLVR